jgi:hypothetical protein
MFQFLKISVADTGNGKLGIFRRSHVDPLIKCCKANKILH